MSLNLDCTFLTIPLQSLFHQSEAKSRRQSRAIQQDLYLTKYALPIELHHQDQSQHQVQKYLEDVESKFHEYHHLEFQPSLIELSFDSKNNSKPLLANFRGMS